MKIKMRLKNIIALLIIFICSTFFIGWGWIGHSIINFNTVLSALPEMDFFEYWADSLADHASDADHRKQFDSNEGSRHYIDIDNYPEFIESGMINHNFDSLVVIHGHNFVMQQGILPWAILKTIDSLQTSFEKGNWHSAMLHASDLGHYIGDSNMPLHLTRNYNGQFTGQYGIHSRYESNMISQYSNQIIYEGDTISYIENLSDYVFNIVYDNHKYVDSVLIADSIATESAGSTNGTAYYEKLWELTKSSTIYLFKNASYKLTCLIYTAWVNAGSPLTLGIEDKQNYSLKYDLSQNYPNPFNPSTSIKYALPLDSKVKVEIFNMLGQRVELLVDENNSAGYHEVNWNAPDLSSGIYMYRLSAISLETRKEFQSVKKMVLIK